MTGAFVILACAMLNRLRGDDSWMPSWLRGRALFYVAPAIGAVAWLVQPWPVALAFALGFALWAGPGWGHILMRVGGRRPDRSPDVMEAALLALPGSLAPVFARMMFILPTAIAVAWLTGRPEFWLAAPAFAAVATVVYHTLFRPLAAYDWLRAELVLGALWGILIVGA
ncbi:hypothetical protein [Bosea sp. MMO-172]|uniref:hypothetical protein n=1 Tax=Bosea sp. MMO-172 TaxID=3127885 RepID=UPI003016C0AB